MKPHCEWAKLFEFCMLVTHQVASVLLQLAFFDLIVNTKIRKQTLVRFLVLFLHRENNFLLPLLDNTKSLH
jgi:hypothetical protein